MVSKMPHFHDMHVMNISKTFYLKAEKRNRDELVKIHLLINVRQQHGTPTEVSTLWFTAHAIHHRAYVQAE